MIEVHGLGSSESLQAKIEDLYGQIFQVHKIEKKVQGWYNEYESRMQAHIKNMSWTFQTLN